jgi:hypothetical protein
MLYDCLLFGWRLYLYTHTYKKEGATWVTKTNKDVGSLSSIQFRKTYYTNSKLILQHTRLFSFQNAIKSFFSSSSFLGCCCCSYLATPPLSLLLCCVSQSEKIVRKSLLCPSVGLVSIRYIGLYTHCVYIGRRRRLLLFLLYPRWRNQVMKIGLREQTLS